MRSGRTRRRADRRSLSPVLNFVGLTRERATWSTPRGLQRLLLLPQSESKGCCTEGWLRRACGLDTRGSVVSSGMQDEGLDGEAVDFGVGGAEEGAHLASGDPLDG